MTINDVGALLEDLAPLNNAEDFDNVGLLVGNGSQDLSGILVTLDTLENVVDEAIEHSCNLIVSFHPIIFNGLKKITGKNYVERVVIKAIQHNICIYAIHTALDAIPNGVNGKICEKLGIGNTRILISQKGSLKKLTTYVPTEKAEEVRNHLFVAGAGAIGNYTDCSFSQTGEGTFKAGKNAKPSIGSIGELHTEKETMISMVFGKAMEHSIITALKKHHPYEEIAYEITTLDNNNAYIGMGMIGNLPKEMPEVEFLKFLKDKMRTPLVRHSKLLGRPIKNVAVLGGSGAFAIKTAKAAGADIFISADVKYHQFFEAEDQMVIADIGHFETEQFTKNLLVDYLTKKIPNFAIRLSESITNPINYF